MAHGGLGSILPELNMKRKFRTGRTRNQTILVLKGCRVKERAKERGGGGEEIKGLEDRAGTESVGFLCCCVIGYIFIHCLLERKKEKKLQYSVMALTCD